MPLDKTMMDLWPQGKTRVALKLLDEVQNGLNAPRWYKYGLTAQTKVENKIHFIWGKKSVSSFLFCFVWENRFIYLFIFLENIHFKNFIKKLLSKFFFLKTSSIFLKKLLWEIFWEEKSLDNLKDFEKKKKSFKKKKILKK